MQLMWLFQSILLLAVPSLKTHGFEAECPLLSLPYMESSTFSQNGEDGIISALLSIIGTTDRTYVEFGVENGTQCNTRNLLENHGFSGLLMDGSHVNDTINLKKEYITPDNILHLFEKYGVPRYFDVFSLDLDMYDWWILERILNTGAYRPRLIVVEVNPTLGHPKDTNDETFQYLNTLPLTVPHPKYTNQTHWDHTKYFGANPRAFQILGEAYGYEMLYCESCGVNCFLVQRSLILDSCLPIPPHKVRRPCYFHSKKDESIAYGHAPDTLNRSPLLLTKDFLQFDLNTLSEQEMRDMVFQGNHSGNTTHAEIQHLYIFLVLHGVLFLSFVYCCCSGRRRVK